MEFLVQLLDVRRRVNRQRIGVHLQNRFAAAVCAHVDFQPAIRTGELIPEIQRDRDPRRC